MTTVTTISLSLSSLSQSRQLVSQRLSLRSQRIQPGGFSLDENVGPRVH